ncbi:MAG: NAD(P)-binding protein [Lachnospiraceae bacterium]|mgnify:CR=1 FL=1|nr:NAD(P)-binding protein [Lachnospiraceae bacterium]MCI6408877.1 NAD(P)-binding protein [Lachnospiraceae bacterium]MDY3253898.1 NAD(P)-binding protein [Lachnospiraceae bacterium]MDY4836310.1 NAD(P)-binding protein [Lachnospiraceae bacterium]MDY5640317.1 NAD(P)-binding protein [Lachnospiraceae bacterium]
MKYLIIGGGPSGLTLANSLINNGKDDVLVLERNEEAGGLCRSKNVDGSPLDIGGGHFLDVKNKRVLDFVFDFMPVDEWDRYTRDSRIVVNDNLIGSPIEANIWQMKLEDQVEYLKAIAVAGCNLNVEMPEKFVDWIYWKLGEKIADDYMIPYNKKMFGENLDSLGTYWLNKLPNVSFDETLISCLERKAYGTQPGHAEFYYPKKYGYGEVWLRMAERLKDKIIYNEKAVTLDLDNKCVNDKYEADIIINTAPWDAFDEIKGLPENLKNNIKDLKHSSIVIDYIPENVNNEAQWIYYPDSSLDYHRILVRHNFCPNSKGYWTETNLDRFNKEKSKEGNYFIMDYAYPLNTIGKPEKMKQLLEYTKSKGVIGLGRWGEWQHYNSDVVVNLALECADTI